MTNKTSSPSAQSFLEKYQDYIFIAIIAFSVFIFLGKAIFTTAGFNASDTIASESFRPYLNQAGKSGEFPQWIPYIFSGMPSYAALLTTGDRTWDFLSYLIFGFADAFGKLFGSDVARIGFWYILYGVGVYLLVGSKKHERSTALIVSLAAVFSTFVITWVMIGHNTKPVALSMFPFVLLGLEKVRERFSLLYAVLLVVAVHIMVESTHLQMVFYGICTFGLYLLFELVSRIIKKEQPLGVIRAGVVLAVAGGLSFAMASDRYLSTLEYTPYSTRGSAPISQLSDPGGKTQGNKQDVNGGNDYQYATNWSFSPSEIMTFFVPNFYGFGKLDFKGPETSNRKIKLMSYYGQMPFTDAANYMGIGVLMLAILGLWHYRRDVFVQYLLALSLFALLLSFGKNFSLLYDFFFYNIPMFNKFRAPSMALVMMQFAVPILAAYGITSLKAMRDSGSAAEKKPIFYALIASGVFLLVGIFYGLTAKSGFIADVAASPNMKQAQYPESIHTFIWNMMINDWYITALFAVVTGVIGWLYVNKKISSMIMIISIGLVVCTDLWRVAVRPIEYAEKKSDKDVFAVTDVISFLKNDTSPYRVADINGFSAPNVAAYHAIESINGYHSAKMRSYQDLLDEAGEGGGSLIVNPFLWNLMNVKYIVTAQKINEVIQPIFTSQQSGTMIYGNPSVLPRAFFVRNAVSGVASYDVLQHLKKGDFNPLDTCFVSEEITGLDTNTSSARAELVERKNEYQKYTLTSSGKHLLFVSEIYYPPSWKAYIDGQEVPILRANYTFRAVVVPSGSHTLEFRYVAEKFETGKNISLFANIFVALAAFGAVFLEYRNRKVKHPSDEKSV